MHQCWLLFIENYISSLFNFIYYHFIQSLSIIFKGTNLIILTLVYDLSIKKCIVRCYSAWSRYGENSVFELAFKLLNI